MRLNRDSGTLRAAWITRSFRIIGYVQRGRRETWRGGHTCARLEAVDAFDVGQSGTPRERIHARENGQRYAPILRISRYKRVHVAPTRRANRWATRPPCRLALNRTSCGTGNKSGNERRSPARYRYLTIVSISNDTHSQLVKCRVKDSGHLRDTNEHLRRLFVVDTPGERFVVWVRGGCVQLCVNARRALASCVYVYRHLASERGRRKEREKPAFIHIAYGRHASRDQRRYLTKIGATCRRHGMARIDIAKIGIVAYRVDRSVAYRAPTMCIAWSRNEPVE